MGVLFFRSVAFVLVGGELSQCALTQHQDLGRWAWDARVGWGGIAIINRRKNRSVNGRKIKRYSRGGGRKLRLKKLIRLLIEGQDNLESAAVQIVCEHLLVSPSLPSCMH